MFLRSQNLCSWQFFTYGKVHTIVLGARILTFRLNKNLLNDEDMVYINLQEPINSYTNWFLSPTKHNSTPITVICYYICISGFVAQELWGLHYLTKQWTVCYTCSFLQLCNSLLFWVSLMALRSARFIFTVIRSNN